MLPCPTRTVTQSSPAVSPLKEEWTSSLSASTPGCQIGAFQDVLQVVSGVNADEQLHRYDNTLQDHEFGGATLQGATREAKYYNQQQGYARNTGRAAAQRFCEESRKLMAGWYEQGVRKNNAHL